MKQLITIHPDKLYTKSAYAKEFGLSRVTLDKRIKDKEIRSIKINGAIIVVKN